MEQLPELVAVHRTDNGVIDVIPDSGAARVGKTALMTLGTGPFGFAAGVLTRDMRAECSKCRKVFARATYSHVLREKMQKLIDGGDIVLRTYTPPPIAEYDPNEVHGPSPAIVAKEQRKVEVARKDAEQLPYSKVGWSFGLAALFWGVFYEGFTDKFVPDFGHIAAIVVAATIAGLLSWWFVNCCRALTKKTPAA